MGLIEAVFEQCSADTAATLLEQLTEGATGLEIVVDGEGPLSVSLGEFVGRLDVRHTWGTVKISSLRMEALTIQQVCITVLRTVPGYDVSFTFELRDAMPYHGVASRLHAWAQAVVQGQQVGTYYAGLEPAEDKETRLFTEGGAGPLVLREFPST
jgi:hypothetical protein